MEIKYLIIIILAAGSAFGISFLYFIKKEKKLFMSLQNMIEDAIEGNFEEKHFNETKLSMIENTLWRYLCDRQVSFQNISKEKQHIQEMIGNISHQTVTPIANILLYAQLLEEGQIAKGHEGKENLEEISAIREQAQKLEFLVDSLVKLSQLEAGIFHLNPKKQSMKLLLKAIKRQFIEKANEKGITITMEETVETAVFDLKWTVEAVANIVDNAIKYTPNGGKIRIYVVCYSFFVSINVEDSGMGIEEKEQGYIFTRFYRSKKVSHQQGLGIGLYLSREVMKAQHGYIKLTSREGEGSVFSLFLPREEKSQN